MVKVRNKDLTIPPTLYKLLSKYKRIKRNYFFDKETPDNLFFRRTGKSLTVEGVLWVYKKLVKNDK